MTAPWRMKGWKERGFDSQKDADEYDALCAEVDLEDAKERAAQFREERRWAARHGIANPSGYARLANLCDENGKRLPVEKCLP